MDTTVGVVGLSQVIDSACAAQPFLAGVALLEELRSGTHPAFVAEAQR